MTNLAELSVPPRHRAHLGRLADLSSEERSQLVEALTALPAFTAMPDVAERLKAVITSETIEEARALAEALIALSAQRAVWSARDLAARVARSEDLAVTEDRRDSFADFLAELIEAKALVTMGKAIDVMTEHAHVYQSARLMTDIRPIFRDEPDAKPTGAALIGLLVLNHTTNGRRQSIHVAMDRADLHELRTVVDRAITKMDSLRSFLDKAELTNFEYEQVDERT